MKEILAKVGKELLKLLKDIDWKPIVYKGLKDHMVPKLRVWAQKSDSKWDDIMVEGVERILDGFLGPKDLVLAAREVVDLKVA